MPIHSSTRVPIQVNMSQQESTWARHESTGINTSPTRVSQIQLDQETIKVDRSFSW